MADIQNEPKQTRKIESQGKLKNQIESVDETKIKFNCEICDYSRLRNKRSPLNKRSPWNIWQKQ